MNIKKYKNTKNEEEEIKHDTKRESKKDKKDRKHKRRLNRAIENIILVAVGIILASAILGAAVFIVSQNQDKPSVAKFCPVCGHQLWS